MNMGVRICTPQLGLSPGATLGGEVYDRETLVRMACLGIEIEVLLPAGQPCAPHPNFHITRMPLRHGYRWFVSNPLFMPVIGRIYRQRPFDLLRVHSLRFTGPAALAARRLYKLPVPIIAHHHHVDRDQWTDVVDRPVAQRCDRIITDSQFSKQQLLSEFGVPSERVEVVYNGVDERYKPEARNERLAEQWGIQGCSVLLYLGSLKRRKNLGALINALALVRQEQEAVRLVFAGEGPEGPALQRHCRTLGLADAVRFVGYVNETEKVAWYNLADVFLLPSRMEGFGLVAAEAMACGRPVVASRAAAIPEVVADGETGILCDPDRPEEFAQAILRLLREPILARRMGQAGRERVKRLFSWDQCVHRTLEIYECTIRGWRGKR